MSEPIRYETEIDPAVLRAAGQHEIADAMDAHGCYTVHRSYAYTYRKPAPAPGRRPAESRENPAN